MSAPTEPRLTREQQARQDALVAALRSGEYKQIRGRLANADGFCCLGVGMDLAAQEIHLPSREVWGHRGKMYDQARHLYGFATHDGMTSVVGEHGYLLSLDTLNDGYELTFAEIADLIEEGVVLTPNELSDYVEAIKYEPIGLVAR